MADALPKWLPFFIAGCLVGSWIGGLGSFFFIAPAPQVTISAPQAPSCLTNATKVSVEYMGIDAHGNCTVPLTLDGRQLKTHEGHELAPTSYCFDAKTGDITVPEPKQPPVTACGYKVTVGRGAE